MQTIIPKLHASTAEPLDFAPGFDIRAFLLEREQGNLLLYRSAGIEQDADEIERLGGITRQYLNHSHEAAPASDWVADRFGAPLSIHADDAAEAAKAARVDATFATRHAIGDDLEAIPTPGHTPGATAYLWRVDGHRALFVGDTIYMPAGEWRAAVLDSSDRERFVDSLELLRELDFDLLVSAIGREGQPSHDFVEPAEARRRLTALIEQVRAG